jgi:7-carboxy-7-deazaguanine synthase
MSLTVSEIFYSLQGESLHSGLACGFVRLTGCNLRCTYCDTRYAYEDGVLMEVGDILDELSRFECSLVEISGGEPLLQKETPLLIEKLLSAGYRVLLETNGTLDISVVHRACVKIVDIKCPSSGESRKNDPKNLDRLNDHDQIKFVIADRDDYLFARQYARRISTLPADHVLFSPVHGVLDPATLGQWILEDRLDVRLQLQLHKILWGNESGR